MKRTQQNITCFSRKSKPIEEIIQQRLDTMTVTATSSSNILKEVEQQEAFSTTTAVEETVPPEVPTCTFPKIWTSDQWAQKKIDYPCLDARDGNWDVKFVRKCRFLIIRIKVYPYLWNGIIFEHHVMVIPLKQSLHHNVRKSTDISLHCHILLQLKFMPILTRKQSRSKWIA